MGSLSLVGVGVLAGLHHLAVGAGAGGDLCHIKGSSAGSSFEKPSPPNHGLGGWLVGWEVVGGEGRGVAVFGAQAPNHGPSL